MAVGKFATPPGGGAATPATTTPTISVSAAAFGVVTVTVTNHASYTNPNFQATAAVGATTTVADSTVDHTLDATLGKLSNTMTFVDTNTTAGTRTLSVRAQEFGNYVQSAAATATYDVNSITARYIRLLAQTGGGATTTGYMGFANIDFYTGQGQTGTAYPTTNLTSNTSETGITISAGHFYSATYAPWTAADSSTGSFWWSLGISVAANNWWQIYFDPATYATAPTIKSLRILTSNQQASHFRILSSNTGAFAGEQTDHGLFPIFNNFTNNYG